MTLLLARKEDDAAFRAQFFAPPLIRRYKEDCPGCVALRDADPYGRFSPGCCSKSCLMRPHRLEDERRLSSYASQALAATVGG